MWNVVVYDDDYVDDVDDVVYDDNDNIDDVVDLPAMYMIIMILLML